MAGNSESEDPGISDIHAVNTFRQIKAETGADDVACALLALTQQIASEHLVYLDSDQLFQLRQSIEVRGTNGKS